MQVTETKAEGLKRAYTAKATAAEIAEKIDARIEEVRPTVQVKGFRKGKVPPSILKKMYGKGLLGEVMQNLVDETMRSHFQETGHKPAKQPDVEMKNETFEEGDDLDIEFSYEMLPEVPEVAFGALEIERLRVEVADEAVQESLDGVADNAKTFETKEGAVEDGDQAVIDFVGRIDGEAFEGGAAEDFPLVVGSGQFIPGFEPQLVGASAGETKDVAVSFPDDYGAENLKGKEAVFEVTVKEVKAAQPHPIDDELAKKYGLDDLDALKNSIRERLSEEYRRAARSLAKRQLLDALNEKVAFDLPDTLVDPEAKQIAHQLWHEENPEVEGHDHPEIEPTEEHRSLAQRRVKLGLVLADIGSKNEIQVTEQELNQAIMERARQYPGQEKAFFDFVRQNAEIRQQISSPLFEDKVVDYVLELASVTDKTVSADELKQALEALNDEDTSD
ncbi:MAG: trigger factor [Pseudomonadota bacterium]